MYDADVSISKGHDLQSRYALRYQLSTTRSRPTSAGVAAALRAAPTIWPVCSVSLAQDTPAVVSMLT